MTKVKICGLQTIEHIQTAVENGVDYIGFMFAPSTRRITVEEAIILNEKIPHNVKTVGVFVNEEIDVMKTIASMLNLDYIQLHGDEGQEVLDALAPTPVIKAISLKTQNDLLKIQTIQPAFFLFDAPGLKYRGGSGNSFDWTLLNNFNQCEIPYFIAGGLHSENVQQAIEQTEPYAVDVSSGVELDGIKNDGKIKQFLSTIKSGEIRYDNNY